MPASFVSQIPSELASCQAAPLTVSVTGGGTATVWLNSEVHPPGYIPVAVALTKGEESARNVTEKLACPDESVVK